MNEVLRQLSLNKDAVFLNLCDGTDDGEGGDGLPGLSCVNLLQKLGVRFTGSHARFYQCSCSKTDMKKEMLERGVSTSFYIEIHKKSIELDIRNAIELIGFPLFVKLNMSYGSVGISHDSVCNTYQQTLNQC